MKIRIKQNVLVENLNYVIRGVSSKNLIPILNCIKFDLKEEGLYLLSTNNEFAIKSFIDKKDITEIIELGELVISGRYIYEIIRKLGNEIITIEEVVDSQVLITTTNSSFKLNCNQASEFPNPWGEGTMVGRPCYEGEITCYPTTMVLDGFASRGGHEFRANGFTHCLQKDWHGGGYSITEYYIRPNGIVKNESADTKEWWVA